jgi:hypothetical protein
MYKRLDDELTGVEVSNNLIFVKPAKVAAVRIAIAKFLQAERARDNLLPERDLTFAATH